MPAPITMTSWADAARTTRRMGRKKGMIIMTIDAVKGRVLVFVAVPTTPVAREEVISY